ncbi:hypothetical protein DS885_03865 [Psychromonas sp. B3M02]|nr:hypothetical protein DS885_03865 [Psychromonas sp. B3M02]
MAVDLSTDKHVISPNGLNREWCPSLFIGFPNIKYYGINISINTYLKNTPLIKARMYEQFKL